MRTIPMDRVFRVRHHLHDEGCEVLIPLYDLLAAVDQV
jgi:hypothetical protein